MSKPIKDDSSTVSDEKTSCQVNQSWQRDTASLRQGKQWSSTLIWLSVVLFGGSLLWGLVGRIDQTVSVRGRLVPAGSVREVDVQSTGVVSDLLVVEGQQVKAGQPLLNIESVGLSSRRRALAFRNEILKAQKIYLSSLLKNPNGDGLEFSNTGFNVNQYDPELLPQIKVVRRESEQLIARFRQLELRESSRRKTLALLQRIVSDLQPLYEEGGIGRVNYLSQLNQVQESQAELATLVEERERLIGDVAPV